jgi:hypothetical protein
MTAHKDLKYIIRERQRKTGESYMAARIHVMRERAELLGLPADGVGESQAITRVDAAVLKVNQQSTRVRILGEEGQVTFRSGDVWDIAPGHIATLAIERRWTWRGDAYASGKIDNPRIDIAKLGLEPLPLEGGELEVVAAHSEPFRRPDPYAALWRKLASKPRPAFEFHAIAWGAFPGLSSEENPVCDAAELREAGDEEGARELLMEVLGADLRCLDAHGHLGNLLFHRSPERALAHYEIGVRIGELSLSPGFDGLLPWGRIYNRPFLRCLHGYGLCLWRLGKLAEAQRVFERILSLNPNDNQGVRFCWQDVRNGGTWEDLQAREAAGRGQTMALIN